MDWRTIAFFEAGEGGERFHYNVLNALAFYYEVPFETLLEPVTKAPAPAEAG